MSDIKEFIKTSMEDFFNKSWSSGDFLTEDDLRCHLFNFFQQRISATIESSTENLSNKLRNLSVHSEIRWYGRDKTLKYRSDIVILDKQHITTDMKGMVQNSKGYYFNKYYSVLEIKLRRPNNKNSDSKYNNIIQQDINKLREISYLTTEDYDNKLYYVIAFDKRRHKKLLYSVQNNSNNTIEWENWSIS